MALRILIPQPIHLEGTTLEGGGQLLRLALGLSTLSRKPIRITNIRGRRSGGGGLKTQHLTCVQWLGQACHAKLSGVGLKAKDITYAPNQERVPASQLSISEVRIDQSTPGSVNLVLQAILPYLLFSGAQTPIRVRITGGTNVSNSPSVEYISQVLLPMLNLIGIPCITPHLHSRGWSQASTSLGSITYTITPLTGRLPAFHILDRGHIIHITATILAPRATEHPFRSELSHVFSVRESRFFDGMNEPNVTIAFEPSHHDKRYYLLLVATTSTGVRLGRDWLYDQAIRPGKLENIIPTMVRKVSDDLLAEIEHGGCVDEFMRDQLIVFQALAEGNSKVFGGRREGELVKPSLHAQTAMWVAEQLLGVDFDEEGGCVGVGFTPGRHEREDEDAELVGSMARLEVSE
ncbi:hypothetical protein ACN47E_009483 [Coniothyrium glycines]